MRLKTFLTGLAMVAAALVGASLTVVLLPGGGSRPRPDVAKAPSLPPISRTSTIIAPTIITLAALREALEAAAPRNLSGTRDNPVSKLLSNAEIGFTVTRGPLGVFGKPDVIGVSTLLTGTFRATGQVASQAAGALGGLLGKDAGRGIEKLAGRTLDQRTDIRGSVAVISWPQLTPAWRLEPNLTSQVSLADASMTLLGVKLNVGADVKPLLERQVAEHVAKLQARLRNDPFLEQTARREWAKLCRSLPIGAAGAGLPNLWLELRPKRAIAAQPRVSTDAMTLLIGVEAETRIVPQETQPSCPFPAELEIVPRHDEGRLAIAVPIDIPFTEVNRLLQAQLAGKTFPEDNSGGVAVTVQRASLAASGERLLISLRVKAVERKSWFGFATETTVHLLGRPVLDPQTQVLRLEDVELDLESEGVLGAAVRAAAPYLTEAVAERTAIDLKPFAANARKSIEAAMSEFRASGEGVRVDAAITDLRLVDIAFDAATLRVIAEAEGSATVTVTSLPK